MRSTTRAVQHRGRALDREVEPFHADEPHHVRREIVARVVHEQVAHRGNTPDRTLRNLVIGSGLEFVERSAYQLKGVPGEWRLFAVASA